MTLKILCVHDSVIVFRGVDFDLMYSFFFNFYFYESNICTYLKSQEVLKV